MRALTGHDHLAALRTPLDALHAEVARIERWGRLVADVLLAGGRLLAAGNGGSAAQAAHLTAELSGRYCDERAPLSATTLVAEPAALSAIGNDYGFEAIFSRQVRAHGRAGDLLVLLSTSGRSPNLVAAAETATTLGMTTLAFTGQTPNPLATRTDGAIAVASPHTPTVQEVHLMAIHLLCAATDAEIERRDAAAAAPAPTAPRPVEVGR